MVYLTRKTRFSALHRFRVPELDDEENFQRFGRASLPHGHGHDFLVEVTVGGRIDPAHGMVVNISDLKPLLEREVVQPFDGQMLTSQHPLLAGRQPSVDVLARLLWDRLEIALERQRIPARLESVLLRQSRRTAAECRREGEEPMVTLTRTYEFAAAHRLDTARLTEDENRELFGKCNNPAGHGHNYLLEVTVGGIADPSTGMLLDPRDLDRAVNEQVVERYDHRHLNYDLPEFQELIPTSENLVRVIWERLEPALPTGSLKRVVVRETDRNAFTYEGQRADGGRQ